jgi:hypothetical protein
MSTSGTAPRAARMAALTVLSAAMVVGGLTAPAQAVGANAVTGTNPASINLDNSSSGDFVVLGTAASGVHRVGVAIEDSDPATPALSTAVTLAGGSAEQEWSVAFPMSDISGLADGRLQILTSFDGAGAPDAQVRLDLLEPDSPTALPDDAVAYPDAQRVVISALDPDDQGRTHYTVGADTAPRPTRDDPVVPGVLVVSRSQQIKAVSFDAAGNRGPTMVLNYVIGETAANGVPGGTAGSTPGGSAGSGTSTGSGGVSSAGRVPVVTGSLSGRRVRQGSKAWVRGTIDPWAGVRVTLRQKSRAGSWSDRATLVIPASSSDGRFRFRVPTRTLGRSTYLVTATTPEGATSSGSPMTLTVRRNASGG